MNEYYQPTMNITSLLFLLLLMLSFNTLAAPQESSTEEDFGTDVRYLYVQKGQTLHNMIKRLYPDRKREWQQITRDIVRLNPHAFADGNPSSMRAGVRLKLPSTVVIKSENPGARVGNVLGASGSVIAVDRNRVSRKLSIDSPVYLGDKIITGADGTVRLKMIDDAVLDLRCYSIMVIEEYALKATNRSSIINLLQGSLRKVTGTIGDMADDVYQLKTPLANVGVRGTEYALRVFQTRGCGGKADADDGLYIKVIDGLVDVSNRGGHEVIARGETAYVALPEKKPEKKPVAAGIIEPKPVPKPAPEPPPAEQQEPEEDGSIWWWLLGIVAVVLLI